MTVFAMNPLYRADPEREWPMVGEAAYWSSQSGAPAAAGAALRTHTRAPEPVQEVATAGRP